jgi:hypothetical protein
MKKKIALGVGGVLLVVILGLVVAASVQPTEYRVERTRVVNATPNLILPQLEELRRWTEWNPWMERDPQSRLEYSEPSSGAGAWYTWDGNDEVGEGKMTIASVSAEGVTYDLEFIEPFTSTAIVGIDVAPVGEDRAEVTWWMEGENDFMGKLMGVFMDMDAMIGADFEQGLENLEQAATGT